MKNDLKEKKKYAKNVYYLNNHIFQKSALIKYISFLKIYSSPKIIYACGE